LDHDQLQREVADVAEWLAELEPRRCFTGVD
jgi:hypothetical protein